MICKREGGNEKFSMENIMEIGSQPQVLTILTQFEKMLIACANPILQVMHSILRGHTISFPQKV